MVNISAMLLEIGVPVAKTTPPPPFTAGCAEPSGTYRRPAREAVCGSPAMRVIFADIKEIFEVVGFIDEQPVDAEFLEGQRVVLLVPRRQELRVAPPAVSCALSSSFTIRRLSSFARCSRMAISNSWICSLKKCSWVSSDSGILSKPEWVTMTASQLPVAMRLKSCRRVLRLEILLARHENVCARIEHEQFGGELAEHVIGHGEQGLRASPSRFNSIPAATIV